MNKTSLGRIRLKKQHYQNQIFFSNVEYVYRSLNIYVKQSESDGKNIVDAEPVLLGYTRKVHYVTSRQQQQQQQLQKCYNVQHRLVVSFRTAAS